MCVCIYSGVVDAIGKSQIRERFAEWTSSSFAYLNHPRDERKKRRKFFFYFFFIFSCCCHVVWAMGQSRICVYKALRLYSTSASSNISVENICSSERTFFSFPLFFLKKCPIPLRWQHRIIMPNDNRLYSQKKKKMFFFVFFVNVYITRTSASSEKCNWQMLTVSTPYYILYSFLSIFKYYTILDAAGRQNIIKRKQPHKQQ